MANVDGGELSLDFGTWSSPSRPRRKKMQGDKLYLAVLPNAETAARMASLGGEFLETHRIDGAARPAQLLHFSLIGFDLSNYPLAAAVPLAERAGASVAMPAFSLSCDQITGFGNRARPALVLTCGRGKSEIETLRGKLADHILRAGFRSKTGFTPHVTIAYAQEPFAEKIPIEPISWTVDRFVLVHSFHGQGQHEHLKHWLLTG